MDKDKVKFKATIWQSGGSKVFAVPQELLDFIEADIGSVIELTGQKKKKGKFVAFWKTKGR